MNMSTRLLFLGLRYRQPIPGKTNHSPKETAGFTLIELLVVIVVIGILAAIAAPSYLAQAQRGKEAKVRTYTGSFVRAQQAYWMEQATFADSLGDLEMTIPDEEYTYSVSSTDTHTSLTAVPSVGTEGLNSYVGIAYLQTDANIIVARTTLCRVRPGSDLPQAILTPGSLVEISGCEAI